MTALKGLCLADIKKSKNKVRTEWKTIEITGNYRVMIARKVILWNIKYSLIFNNVWFSYSVYVADAANDNII